MTLSVETLCVALCRRTAERASAAAHPRNNNFERPRCISRQFNRGLGFAILELAQLLSVCDSQFRRALVSFPAVRRFPTMFLSLPARQSSPILTLFQPTTPLALHCLSSSLMEFYSIAAPHADIDGVIQTTLRPATTACASCWR